MRKRKEKNASTDSIESNIAGGGGGQQVIENINIFRVLGPNHPCSGCLHGLFLTPESGQNKSFS